MTLSVNTNMFSLNAQNAVAATQKSLGTSMARLSSGKRINSAKDDAAGLAIADRMQAQINGMNVAIRNANDASGLAATGAGALSTVSDALQQMRQLAVQAANVTNTSTDRANLDASFQQLAGQITQVLSTTQFNGLHILGSDAGSMDFQVGANAGETISVTTQDMTQNADVTAVTGSDITTSSNASAAITAIDTAINTVSQEAANYGAYQNRFDTVVANLQTAAQNQTSARGQIVDADFAAETANVSREQVLQQAGMAMIAQANTMPQQVLSLLKNL